MMTCRQTTERVTDAREGKLTMWERVRYRMHLGVCHHCRRFVRQLDEATRELESLRETDASVPAQTKSQLLAQFRERKR